MQNPAEHLGRARIWKDGEECKWFEAGKRELENAESAIATRGISTLQCDQFQMFISLCC